MRRAPAAALAALRSRLTGVSAEAPTAAAAAAAAALQQPTTALLPPSPLLPSAAATAIALPPLPSLIAAARAFAAAAASPATAARRATPSQQRARVLHRKPASSRHRERMPVDPYTRPPVTYVQLLQHIHRARDVRALEALVDAHGARFDAVHASAAMAALPRVLAASAVEHPTPEGSRRPAELLARLQAMALQNRERMQARQIANAVWSAGRCRQVVSAAARDERRRAVGAQRVPASALLQAGELAFEEGAGTEGAAATGGGSSDAAAEAEAGAASPVATAAQLLALEREQARARLRQRRSQAALPRWRGDAAGAALASLPTSADLDAGPAAASRAAVRELLAELGRGGFRKLYQGGAPADAAQLLHGLARLRLAPPPSLLRHLQAFVAKRSAEFDARHLAVSAWALSRLAGLEREKQQQQGAGAARPARRAEAGVAAPLPGPLDEVIVARALEQADFFRPWSACALLYAFARPVAPRVAAAAAGREEEEGGGGEPHVDYRALGRALAEGLARVVVAEADARAPTPQQMASLAWAYGRLGVWGGGGSGGGGDSGGGDGSSGNNDTVAASLARCALESLGAFGPTDLSLLLSGLAESAAAGVRDGTLAPGQPLPPDVARLLAAVASGIAGERAVRLASAEDAARLLRAYATFAGKGLYAPQDAEEAEALEGMALRLAGGAAAHTRGATARTARELATLLPRLLLRRGGFGRRGLAGDQEDEDGSSADADAAAAVEAATADLLRAAGSAELTPAAAAGNEESGARRASGFAGTEAADLLDVLADAHASSSGGRARREPDARLLAALLQARGALALPPHDELCRQAAACLSALSARVQELAGVSAGAVEALSSSSSSPLLRPLEQATDLAAGLAEARRLGAESGAAAARAALAASASAAEPKPKLRTLARLCRALSSDVAVMQQPPVRLLLEACAGPFDAAAATAEGGLPVGAAASAAVALARAIRHGYAPATSRDLALRLADAADEQGHGDPLVARDVDEARGLLLQAVAATGA